MVADGLKPTHEENHLFTLFRHGTDIITSVIAPLLALSEHLNLGSTCQRFRLPLGFVCGQKKTAAWKKCVTMPRTVSSHMWEHFSTFAMPTDGMFIWKELFDF